LPDGDRKVIFKHAEYFNGMSLNEAKQLETFKNMPVK
jgi:hypothetical protein